MARRNIAAIMVATLVFYLPSTAFSQEDKLSAALATILQDRDAIHLGDTKTRLEELFLPDGGLSSVDKRTYVSRRCPYVKVDGQVRNGLATPQSTCTPSTARDAGLLRDW
jgi:hypothetical protein